jgi:hypothetical protein
MADCDANYPVSYLLQPIAVDGTLLILGGFDFLGRKENISSGAVTALETEPD